MNNYYLKAELWVSQPLETVFPFFGNAGNLDELTPPWLHFQILTERPIWMQKGTIIDYKLRLHGIPVKWRTEIIKWDPPFEFVDSQIKGPYKKWIHSHRFQEKQGGTLIEDQIEYAIWIPFLDSVIHRMLVRPDLDRIFSYRRQKLVERYGESSHVGKLL